MLTHDVPLRIASWPAGGMSMNDSPHIPVLGAKALEYLAVRDGGVYLDATFGAGGYSRAMLAAADCRVIGIDRDQSAIAGGADLVEAAKGRLTLVEDQFSNLDEVARNCGVDRLDGVVLDLGVSSMQLDRAERGFSFRHDGPLDMRMGGEGPSAAHAHVERTVVPERKATLGAIELHRRDAEVEHHAIEAVDPAIARDLIEIGELIFDQRQAAFCGLDQIGAAGTPGLVAVDADDAAIGGGKHRAAITAGAEGGIQVNAAIAHGEVFQCLGAEDGYVGAVVHAHPACGPARNPEWDIVGQHEYGST